MSEKYIIKASPEGTSITCLECGLTSFNPHDIKNRYCGFCHKFHDVGETLRMVRKYEMDELEELWRKK